MSDEKANDFNDVHAPRRMYHEAHHPSIVSGCWCGATTGPLLWDGRRWCSDCIPLAGVDFALGRQGADEKRDAFRARLEAARAAKRTGTPAMRALTDAVNRLCTILEAIATHGGTLTLNKMDKAAPREPMPLQPGERASYNGRRGVLRSIGVAGTGILYDDGRYALLTNAMAVKLVRE